MNKNLYRIVFNKARGMLMVVADIAASGRVTSSASSGVGHTQRRCISALSSLSFSLLLALGCISLSAQANIVADARAPGNQQPTIISSANGTPQVNIQTPSSGGVSRNVYSQFDVDHRGAILNNGHGINQTQLGGFVNGNPSLARGEASVILNEVNSRDPSQLNGYIEVAGRKAQVVIANPAGITCEGCGFINANRATLTTGQAQLNNGQITGYDVDRGEIIVRGAGMDSSRQDHTDLIARSVKVNAGIWANDLKVSAGRNQVDAAHQNINAKASDGSVRPTVAVDVASLGGMYAGKIRLIGTESGVGVRNAGEIGASAGDITITADGMLINSGQINSAQQLAVKTSTGIENAGALYAQGNNQLTTAGTLSNSGTIAAAGDTSLRAAEVNSSRNSVLGAGVKSDNSTITSGTLRVDASGMLTAQGKNISGTALALNARSLDLGGSQTQSRDLTLTAQSGDIDLTGANLSASHRLSVSTTDLLRTDKANVMAEQMALDAHTLSNIDGVIAQTGAADFNLKLPGYLDNRGGSLIAKGNLGIDAARLDSNGNSLLGAGVQSDGKLTATGDLAVATGDDLIAQGQTVAAGALTLSGSQLDLTDGRVQAREMQLTATAGDIVLTGAKVNAADTLSAKTGQTLHSDKAHLTAEQIEMTAGSLSNVDGQIIQTGRGDFHLNLPGELDNRGGVLLAAGNMRLQADKLTSNDHSLLGAGIHADGRQADSGNLQVNTAQALMAQGQNVAVDALTLSGSQIDLTGSQTQASNIALTARDGDVVTREATVLTPGTLAITAAANREQNLDNRGGKLHANNLRLDLARLDNGHGEIAAATDAWIALQRDFTHQVGTRLTAGRDLVLHSAGALINQHKLEAGRDMQVTAVRISNADTHSGLLAGRDISLHSDSLFNRGAIYATHRGQFTVNGNAENHGEIYTEQPLTFTTSGNLVNRGVLQTGEEMQLSTQGDLNNSGTLYAGGDQMQLSINGNLTNAGSLYAAHGSLDLLTDGDLANSGSLYAGGNGKFTTHGNGVNSGSVYSQGALQWQAGGKVANRGSLAALGDLQLHANDLLGTHQSLIGAGLKSDGNRASSGDLTVSTEQGLVAEGQNIAAGQVALSGRDIDLTGSQTQGHAISLVAQSGDITLTDAVVNAATTLSARTAARLRTDKANVMAEQMALDAHTLSNIDGVIAQTGAADFNLKLPGYLDNRGGSLIAKGNLGIDAARLDSNGNSLLGAGVQSDGKLTATGDLAVATGDDLIAQGQTVAAGALTLSGSRVDLTDGQMQAREIKISANKGDVTTQRANMVSLGSLTINAGANLGQTLNNQGGTLQANNIYLNLGRFDGSEGNIRASQDLTIGLQSDFSHLADSKLQAGRDLTFTTTGALTNDGQLVAGRKLSTKTNSLLNNGKILAVEADLRTVGAMINQGEILTSGWLASDTNTLFNSGSIIGAEVELKARERMTNSGTKALIGATDEKGTLALLAPVIENSDTVTNTDTSPSTTILGMGKVVLAGGQDNSGNYQTAAQILNLSGLIESGKDLLIYANTLTNRRHVLTANTQFVAGDTVNGTAYWTPQNPDIPGGRYIEPPHGGKNNSSYINTSYTSTTSYNSIDKISPEAQLLAGGNLTPHVGTLENYWSKVSAQGEINLTGVALQQDGWGSQQRLIEKVISKGYYHYRTYKGRLWTNGWGPEVKERSSTQYASSLTAKTLTGSGTVINNGANPGSIASPASRDSTGKNITVEFNGVSLTLPSGGLYRLNTDKGDYAPEPDGGLSFANVNTPSTLDSTGKRFDSQQTTAVSLTPSTGELQQVNAVGGKYEPDPEGALSFASLSSPSFVDSTGQQLNSNQSQGLNRSNLSMPNRAVGGGYLIETNPAFANLNHWKGSDAYLQTLNNDPSLIHKRLGDNMYEQRLVRDQVLALTGKTVASDYRSAQEQFEQLFAAGAQYSKRFNLSPGTHLSAEQMATLTDNIVLMETREVAGQTVLVPVVYLARVKPGELHANGALIAADNIELTDVQGLTNQGAIKATDNLRIGMAKDIILNSRGGLLQAGNNLQLSTLNSDIDLTSARINATNLQLDSGRDVILRTAGDQLSSNNGVVQRTQTVLGPLASINISNNAVINTERDFIQQGAGLNVGQDLQVNTGGDWILNTVQSSDQISANYGYGRSTSEHIRHLSSEVNVGGALTAKVDNFTAVGARINAGNIHLQAQNIDLSAASDRLQVTGSSSSKRHTSSVNLYDETLLGSELISKGNIHLQAVRDINLSASKVETEGAMKLAAGGDVTLTTQTEQHDAQRNHTGKSQGLASRTTTRTEDSLSQRLAVGSMLSAGTIDVSGKNVVVTGSHVVADKEINLRAKENITVGTVQQSESESHLFEQKKSGLMTTGGIGITVGSNSNKVTDNGKTFSSVGSMVGSVQGNVNITAGEDLRVQGSDVLAGKDIHLTGKNVAIVAAENQLSQTHSVEQKQSGLTLALSGPVGSAINTAVTTAKAASEESNGRLAALQGVKAALSGVQAVQAGQLVQAEGGDTASMFGISASLGSQKSSSQQHQEQTSVAGSTLTAGNNLSVMATGEGNSANSGDILIAGSQLKAGGDTTLDAARDVLLLGAANTQKTDGSNRSSGGSVGVSLGMGGSGSGLSVFANANKGQGRERGDGTFWSETQVDSGGTLSLHSGRDTSLIGAQASGESIKADVGRDLLLQSQQDSDNYDAKQTSTSGGISMAVVGGGGSANLSMSRDKLHSNYDSVQEQTGFFAGKGGFDITVGEHTQLDGAVIASTADKSKNSLDTGTLGFSNIENKADFKAEHQGGSLSTGGPVGSDLLSNLGGVALSGLGNDGHAEGTTQAAVADGSITIRETDKQQQNVDDLSRDTDNANDRIDPIFDKEKEQRRLKEAQLIGEIGGQAMDIARTQGDINGLEKALKHHPELKGDAKALRETKEYQAAMQKYGTGSPLQQGLQAATAAIQGLAGGDMAKALAGASAPYLAEVIKKSTGNNQEANLMAHAVLGAVVAKINGDSALSGASGAAMGEYIAQQMYPGVKREDLSEEQRQTLSALSTLASGLSGGLAGDSTADAVAGAQAGKNAVENNALSANDFGKGMADYGQSVASYAQYAQEKNLPPEQVQADLARMVKGDLPESANIIKAILENNPGSDTVMAVLSAEDAKDYALALLTSIPAEKALSLVGKAAKVIDNKILISAAEKISTAKPGKQSAVPRDLNEQIVWKQVQENPAAGEKLIGMNNDPRFPASAGFQKMQVVQKNAKGESITVHYQYNSTTGKAYDMKIDTPQRVSSNPADVIENIKGQVK
ncbi:hemagglutinin repeat-containing protein [Yersinia ruckeri]|uniref:two-partner secretion domain-containing protein n=2 Tax=Yersinia ruckeri TaxID=29486 RepID=UPI0028161317|nr:hemagglutinin repeat-containing protein [Yersinia ruckeri]WMS06675.1 hemagglutinin repeat-containing protein [Yersinia ruckeri]